MRFTAAILAATSVTACLNEAEGQMAAPSGTKRLDIKSIHVRDTTEGAVWGAFKTALAKGWNKAPHKECMTSAGVQSVGKFIRANLDGYHKISQIRVFTEPTFDKEYTAANAVVYAGWKVVGKLADQNTCNWEVFTFRARRAKDVEIMQPKYYHDLTVCGIQVFGV